MDFFLRAVSVTYENRFNSPNWIGYFAFSKFYFGIIISNTKNIYQCIQIGRVLKS